MFALRALLGQKRGDDVDGPNSLPSWSLSAFRITRCSPGLCLRLRDPRAVDLPRYDRRQAMFHATAGLINLTVLSKAHPGRGL